MSKKLLALLLALVMIVGSFTSVFAADTVKTDEKKETVTEEKKDEKSEEKKDEKSEEKKEEKTEEKTEEKKEEEPVKTDNPALTEAITVLKKAGFISGYSKDSDDFKVEKNVTRAEFASMIVRAMGLEDSAKALANLPTGFKDVPANLWANGYIAVAKQQGFVNGYPNGTFKPNAQVSYQDMATMLTIALGQAEAGTVYPAGYIVKAQQLGLFNKVDVPAYTDMATRGNVFIMLYNMITSKEFGQRKIVKAIVLENSRVEKMANDEIVVEVIKVVQEANWVGANRDKRGDQHKYVLDKDLKLDVEDLLGKVIDLTVNKDDKIVDVKVDKTYDYLDGAITSVDHKKFGLNGTKYTALFDERYASEDDRIYRTYLNDRDKKYEDFARYYEKGDYDYARVTVKNGKVIFIDAFKFDDVAPVKEVKDGDVYYYDDADYARVKRAADLSNRLVFSDNGKFSIGEKKLVAADDVIHFYAQYTKAIVKKNAKTELKLVKTYQDRDGREWAVLENKDEYRFDLRNYFNAVYSYEGKEFMVVKDRGSVNPIVGRKVKLLSALNGTVQLIQSDLAWNDGIQAIRQITSKGDVRLLPPTGKDFWSVEGRNTKYYDASLANNNLLFNDFRLNDIVFYRGEGKDGEDQVTAAMGLLFHKHQTYEGTKVNAGYADRLNKAKVTDRYITVSVDPTKPTALYNAENQPKNLGAYRYFNNLNAYYIDVYGNLQQVGDMGKFITANKGNTNLKAFVVSELELKQMIEYKNNIKSRKYADTYYFLSDSKLANDVARLVVFDGEEIFEDTKTVYAMVTEKINYTNPVTFEDANGKVYKVNITDGIDHKDFEYGDIVELKLDKDTLDKDIQEGYFVRVAIHAHNDNELYRIESQDYNNSYKVTKYVGGQVVDAWFTPETNIFNNMPSGWAKIDFEDGVNNKFVRNILFVDEPKAKPVTGFKFVNKMTDDQEGKYLVLNNEAGQQQSYRVQPTTPDRMGTMFVDRSKNPTQIIGYGYVGTTNLYAKELGAIVELEFDRDGRLAVVAVVKSAQQIADEAAAKLLKEAEDAVKSIGKFTVKYQTSGAETKPSDAKAAFQAEVNTKLAGKSSVTNVTKDKDTFASDAYTNLATTAHEGAFNTILTATATYCGKTGTAVSATPVVNAYHVNSKAEEEYAKNKDDAEAILAKLAKVDGKPVVKVDLSATPVGNAVETELQALVDAVKGSATAVVKVAYANNNYSATIKVGTANEYTLIISSLEIQNK